MRFKASSGETWNATSARETLSFQTLPRHITEVDCYVTWMGELCRTVLKEGFEVEFVLQMCLSTHHPMNW